MPREMIDVPGFKILKEEQGYNITVWDHVNNDGYYIFDQLAARTLGIPVEQLWQIYSKYKCQLLYPNGRYNQTVFENAQDALAIVEELTPYKVMATLVGK